MRRVMRSLSRHLRSPSVMESIIVFMLNWLRMISWKFMWELQHLTSEKSKTSKVAWIFVPKMCFPKIRIFWGFLLFWRENSNTCSVFYLNLRAEIISWWSVGLFAVLNFGAKIQLKLYIFRAKIQIRQLSTFEFLFQNDICHEFMNFRCKVAKTKILILFFQFWRENSKFFIFSGNTHAWNRVLIWKSPTY